MRDPRMARLSEEVDPSFYNTARGVHQTQNGKAGHTFAGTGFADQAKHFASAHAEAHAVHGAYQTASGEEVRVQVVNVENDVGHGSSFSAAAWG